MADDFRSKAIRSVLERLFGVAALVLSAV